MTFVLPAIRSRNPAAGAGRKRRAQPEEALQLQVVRFLKLALGGNSEFFAVPNGGKRNFREAQRLKAAGVKAGAPDLFVFNDGRAVGIELKAGKNGLTDVQADYHNRLRQARVPVSVCRSIGEVEAALRAAGVPLRATTEARVIGAVRGALAAEGA